MAIGLHALVVIVLSGQDFAVWIVSGKEIVRVMVTAIQGTWAVHTAP